MLCRASTGAGTPSVGARLDATSGFSGECVRRGKTLRCDDSETDSRVDVVSCRRLGIRSILAVPILLEGHVVGLLEVFSSHPFAFDDNDVAGVERLAKAALLTPPASNTPPASKATPPPKLLVELEPAHRVFFRNLLDILRPRRTAPLKLSSPPARFWPDVFVPAGMPWEGFFQSIALHVMMIAVVGSLLQLSLFQPHPLQYRAFDKSQVIYYLPTEYAPQLAQARVPAAAPKKERVGRANPTAISVRRELNSPKQAAITPPEIKLKQDLRLLHIMAVNAIAPAAPLSATTGRQLMTPATLVAVVAPPPDLSTVSRPRALGAPATAVIEPPPSVQRSIRLIGDINIGHLQVITPAPQLPLSEQNSMLATAQAALGNAATSVVPPQPSLNGMGNPGRQRPGSPPGAAMQVVPPPPSVQRAGSLPTGTPYGSAMTIVPPPPSASGLGNSARQRIGAAPGNAVQVVPPPPVVQRAGNFPNGTPYGTTLGVVPPPPPVNGFGNSGNQRMGAAPGAAMRVVPPPPLIQQAANFLAGSPGGAALAVVPPPPSANAFGNPGRARVSSLAPAAMQFVTPPAVPRADSNTGSDDPIALRTSPPGAKSSGESIGGNGEVTADAKELSVSFLGPALPLPSSSYFSSHEVFIAEERLSRHQSRLIKLVYEFLPYQPRLSEYGPNYPAVDKLRTTRDPSCDETLMQVTSSINTPEWLQAARPQLDSKYSNQRQSALPCYRTTADDYRRARTRQHR